MESFKANDAASYDAVASDFAYFSALTTRPLAATMVHLAAPRPEHHVLDVATGSGIVALTAATQIRGKGWITGIDLSEGLLAVARENASRSEADGRIQLARADAEALPFSNGSFDRVLSLFALLHFPHPDRALAEMFRVLRPQGRAVIGLGSGPPCNSMRGWTHRIGRLPDLIRLGAGRLLLAPAHLDKIVSRHVPVSAEPEETELARGRRSRSVRAETLMHDAGFRNIQSHWEGHCFTCDSSDEFWRLQKTFSSFARKRLSGASADQALKVRREFTDDCNRVLMRRGKLVFHYGAFYLSGERNEF
jgi:SAM-dependent methyltransferase